jgi:RNA polymerase sigma factor (sigma-70 family)
MNDNSEALHNFDNFITENYQKVYTHAYCTTGDEEQAHDLLQDTYIKVRTFIEASGYTTNRFITHFCKSITNAWIDKKRKRVYEYVDFNILDDSIDEDNLEEEQQHIRELKCKTIFQYIEKKYDERENYIFRVYFLFPPKERMTFQKISNQTGISLNDCSIIIRKIREDCKKTFGTEFLRLY